MQIQKIFFALLLLGTSVFAIVENEIKSAMEIRIQKAVHLLQNKEIDKEEKTKQLFVIMDDVFDFEIMAKISLGKTFNDLSADERREFTQLFVQRIKNSYLDKIDLYTDEAIVVKELTKVKENRIQLVSNIVGKEQVYDVVYKFYDKNGDWLVYDVDILGVSIVQTYRKQFAEFLQTKTFTDLLDNLKSAK